MESRSLIYENDLNFKDSQTKTKKDIKDLIIGKGRKKEKFRPDYLIFLKNKFKK